MPTPDLRRERCSQRVSPSPYPWAAGATQGDSCECRNGGTWRGSALAAGTTRWLTGRGTLRQSAVRGIWDARGVAVRSLCQVALTCGLCAENLPGLREPCRPRGHATSHPARAARPHEGPLTVRARLLHHGVLRKQYALRQGPPTPGRSRDHKLCIPEQAAPVSPVAYPRDAVDKARDRGAGVPAS
jgi:hypothetical protein